ncbi:phosphatidylinositol kinase related protein [Novymonas esmeraldas]|uniref:non-specific serine/threonine protein kinase n=1 Tax=Novymonas esmeraldas TaxID=1808958 RepID=A0AAW0EZY9_9TRYP
MDSFLTNIDVPRLKERLNTMMADVNAAASTTATNTATAAAVIPARDAEEAGRCLVAFASFFAAVAERHGTAPHVVLGLHVVSNVLVFALERVVKPHVLAYCRVAEKHAANAVADTAAAAAAAARGGGAHTRDPSRPAAAAASTVVAGRRRDALEMRRRRLRADVIRPFMQLFTSVHAPLAAAGEPHISQTRDASVSTGSVAAAAAGAAVDFTSLANEGSGEARVAAPPAGTSRAEEEAATAAAIATDDDGGALDYADGIGDVRGSEGLCEAPLLWKSASPLNLLCNHILEGLESPWVASAVGVDYAALLHEVVRWSGYARLITPAYLVRVSHCLVTLMERVPLGEEAADDAGVWVVGPNLVAQEVADGRVWVAAPSPDHACVYAQLLARLYALPHFISVYPTSSPSSSVAALALVQRTVALVRARHQSPTPDLRLEAYCIAMLRHLCVQLRSDHPVAAQASVDVVKLLCDFMFLPQHTPRHDVWRLEAMQLIAVALASAMADVVAAELRDDLDGGPLHEAAAATAAADRWDSAASAQPLIELLHVSVLPTMWRLWGQQRHEYSFMSRRELFSAPCSPLQDVFDFGAAVMYLASITHAAYRRGGAGHIACDGAEAPAEAEETAAQRGRKRPRASAVADIHTTVAATAAAAAASSPQPPSPSASSHPMQTLVDALHSEFFMPAPPLEAVRPPHSGGGDASCTAAVAPTRRRAGAAPLVLRVGLAGSTRTSSTAVVQDVVSDAALFLLHLCAQPCATLRAPSALADQLVEDMLLPLGAHFSTRLGPLLMAALTAVLPRCSGDTQHYAFAVVAQRTLPTAVARWSGSSGSGSGSGSGGGRDEDVLAPSEPAYRVLVTLLEQRLCHAKAVAESAGPGRDNSGGGGGAGAAMCDLSLRWSAHLRSAVQRTVARLHAWEQETLSSDDRVRSGTAAASDAAAAAAAAATAVVVAVPPVRALRRQGGDLHAGVHRPLLTPSAALLLMRYATLVQCTRLWRLSRPATAARHRGNSGDDGSDDVGDVGVAYACHVAAHGACFYEAVPVLSRAAVGCGDANAEALTMTGVFAGAATASPCGAAAALLAAPLFVAWLDAAEAHASTALWAHMARLQAEQRARPLPHLRGALRRGVDACVERVCTSLTAATASSLSLVPAVLRDAADAHWVLRTPARSSNIGSNGNSGGGDDRGGDGDDPGVDGAVPTLHAAAAAASVHRAVPLSFYVELTEAVLPSVEWLMRRAKVLEQLQQQQQQDSISAESAAARVHLSVQCVQLLHLLLRWRRAALWSPPEETSREAEHACVAAEAAGDADAGDGPGATCADQRLLRTTSDLRTAPITLLHRFSAAGGGRLYYAVLWLCDHVAVELDGADAAVTVAAELPLWAALRLLLMDVGAVLLDPTFACVDPRQTALRLVAATTARLLSAGVRRLSRWRPTNPTSRDVAPVVSAALVLAADTLRTVLRVCACTHISAYAATPLVDVAMVSDAVRATLSEQALIPVASGESHADPAADAATAGTLADALLSAEHPLLGKLPFLPPVLPAVPVLLRLLALAGAVAPAEWQRCCVAVLHTQQTLFTRYRYQLGPALSHAVLCGVVADVARLPASATAVAAALFAVQGRLALEWTAQLMDAHRTDMPLCTPAWQCALLQAAFTVLPRCEPTVAETLGRTAFGFLASGTAYAVRRHAAAQVGTLFATFSSRRTQVLHTLLARAREGVLSPTPLFCSTSLLALSEAVRAAPELQLDVVYTLLECWATRGFSHPGLVVECLNRIATWVLAAAAATSVAVSAAATGGGGLPRALSYTRLCCMHARPLLFLWLCESRHPLAALPVTCFGFTTQRSFVDAHRHVLCPLALLLMTESGDAQWATANTGHAAVAAGGRGVGGSALYEEVVMNFADALVDAAAATTTVATARARDGAAQRHRISEDPHTADSPPTGGHPDSDAVAQLRRRAPLWMLLAHFADTVAQLVAVVARAPVPLFGGDAAVLDDEAAAAARGGRDGEGAWVLVARRCCYWLEMQLNTAELDAVLDGIAWVLGGGVDTATTAAPRHAATNAAAVLLCYLRHRGHAPAEPALFNLLVAAQADAVMDVMVGLHRSPAEPDVVVYATPPQLQRALAWVAERVVALSAPSLEEQEEPPQALLPHTAIDVDATPAPSEPCSPEDAAELAARCWRLLVPPAACDDGDTGAVRRTASTAATTTTSSSAAAALTGDVTTRFLLRGGGTYLHALLCAAYRASTSPRPTERPLRAVPQLSLLVHVCSRWCSASVLTAPHTLQMVLTFLLHWLRRSSAATAAAAVASAAGVASAAAAAAAQELVCRALLHVWPVACAGCGDAEQCATPELRGCRRLLARAVASLAPESPLIASTWAALCRSDPQLVAEDWQRRARDHLADAERTGDTAGTPPHSGPLSDAVADVMSSGTAAWTWASYVPHRTALVAPLSCPRARARLGGLRPLLCHVAGGDGAAPAIETAAGGGRGTWCDVSGDAALPAAPLLRDVAAAVDAAPALLVRCLQVAEVCHRARAAGAGAGGVLLPEEQEALAVRSAVLACVRQLYRVCDAHAASRGRRRAAGAPGGRAATDAETHSTCSEEQLRACFRLLRGLSVCVLSSGAAHLLVQCVEGGDAVTSVVDATVSLGGIAGDSAAEDVVAATLARAYVAQLHTLERLADGADAGAAALALEALRTWAFCAAAAVEGEPRRGVRTHGGANTLTGADTAVAQLLVAGLAMQTATPAEADAPATPASAVVMRRFAWLLRSSGGVTPLGVAHRRDASDGAAALTDGGRGRGSHHHHHGASLCSESVWAPLLLQPPNERAFVCRFVVAAIGACGLLRRSVLWAALLPLLAAELRDAEGADVGGRVCVAELLLLPVLLHMLCTRESEGQRATRDAWSALLDRHVVCQAERCAHTARLFLRVLHTCHVVLLRATRQRGLKGAATATASASGASAAAVAVPWPTALGAVPVLSDMRECHWLAAVPADHLARAAALVHEPHLALLFAQLAGESLYGSRTGAASLSGDAQTTWSALLLRGPHDSGAASTASSVVSAPFSVLFPIARESDYPPPSAQRHAGAAAAAAATTAARAGGGREREQHDAVQQQTRCFAQFIFEIYAAAEAQVELDAVAGVSAMVRLQSSPLPSLDAADVCGHVDGEAAAPPLLPPAAAQLRYGLHGLEACDTRAAVAVAGDAHAAEPPESTRGDAVTAHLRRAALLLQHGCPSAAVDTLLSLHPHTAVDDAPSPGWTAAHEASLRGLLAEAAWRCSRWPATAVAADAAAAVECVPHAVLARLSLAAGRSSDAAAPLPLPPPPATGAVHVHVLGAFVALSHGQLLLCRQHILHAETLLRVRLSATTFASTMLAAQALSEVRDCAARLDANSGAAPHHRRVELPPWLRGGSGDASPLPSSVPYASRALLDSVRHALCQVYGDVDGWCAVVLGATGRALQHGDASTARRWLMDWEAHRHQRRDAAAGASAASGSHEGAQQIAVTLRHAQAMYGLGRCEDALALLQPTAAAAVGGARVAEGVGAAVRTALWSAPQDPRVVQQLMLWHAELRLVPPSQLVRDPFLSRAAATDQSGACGFSLAVLCHTLADEVAARLTSHEHQRLRASVAESTRLRAQLEAQLEAAGKPHAGGAPTPVLGADQLRVVRRRVREIAGDVKRLEDEWHMDVANYSLYRRSALNSYSRFLQLHYAAAQSSASRARGADTRGGTTTTAAAAAAAAAEAVTCVPADHEEDVLHAVFGFVELWLNAEDIDSGGGGEVLQKVLSKATGRIPTAALVPLAAQLAAQLGSAQEGDCLARLLTRVAHDYPLQVAWPLLALCNGHTFGRSCDVNTMHSVDEAKVAAAQRLLRELTGAEQSDTATARTSVAAQVRHAQLLSSAYLQLAFDPSTATAQPDKQHAIRRDCQLLQDAHHLCIPPPTTLDLAHAVPMRGDDGDATPRVLRFLSTFTTPGGVNVPKVLQCELSDGSVVRQLLKAGDDLRQDYLIEHIFTTANTIFLRRPSTRPLRTRTFTVVPLAPTAGVLQWVERTAPLGEYITGRHAGRTELPGAHERYFPGELTSRECRAQLQGAAPSAKTQVLLALYKCFTPALHYFFLEACASASAWVTQQQTFTRSVATSSIVGYVVGLGDRHINNILLHRETAEVVHIDLGIAFDQGRLLPVPELVPFRMTRNIIDGLGVRGTEGSLRPSAEAVMAVLRSKRELLRTILSSVMHDPLARWAIGAARHAHDDIDAPSTQRAQQPAPTRHRGTNADAARTLARVDAKLRGHDGSDVLSVPTHVRKLIDDAQRVENLAVMFPGWSQWV